MISGIDLQETVDYSLKDDTDNPTIWKLGMIPSSMMARIGGMGDATGIEQMLAVVKHGLKGWSNFNVEYEAKEGQVLPEVLDRLPVKVITELGMEILKINKMSGEEEKN